MCNLQCKTIIKTGNRCKRKIKNGEYCFQHKKIQDKKIKKIQDKKIKKIQDKKIEIIEKIKTECGICYEEVDCNIVFNCNHNMCNTCVIQLNSFNCPYCRADIQNNLNKEQIEKITKNIQQLNKERDEEYIEMLRRYHILEIYYI